MQTILGSGGAIGKELAKALPKYTDNIRLVSRHPEAVNKTDQLFAANLLDARETNNAVAESSIVYLTVGLDYNISTWKEKWPVIIKNTIEACKNHQSKLVFFDNIYMYDQKFLDGMTEETPINPPSKKGKVRAYILNEILKAVEKGHITALIARSADFYGPQIQNTSILTETVIKPLAQGKKAQWIGGLHHPHSFTYTPDAGTATAVLGNTTEAYNQTWHLPTAPNPLTGQEWVDLIAHELDVKSRVQSAPKIILKTLGLFSPIMKELSEMVYQYDCAYVFDSKKFEKKFDYTPTSYQKGIKMIVSEYK